MAMADSRALRPNLVTAGWQVSLPSGGFDLASGVVVAPVCVVPLQPGSLSYADPFVTFGAGRPLAHPDRMVFADSRAVHDELHFEMEKGSGLPPGLALDRRTGSISGTPTSTAPRADYTVWASAVRTAGVAGLLRDARDAVAALEAVLRKSVSQIEAEDLQSNGAAVEKLDHGAGSGWHAAQARRRRTACDLVDALMAFVRSGGEGEDGAVAVSTTVSIKVQDGQAAAEAALADVAARKGARAAAAVAKAKARAEALGDTIAKGGAWAKRSPACAGGCLGRITGPCRRVFDSSGGGAASGGDGDGGGGGGGVADTRLCAMPQAASLTRQEAEEKRAWAAEHGAPFPAEFPDTGCPAGFTFCSGAPASLFFASVDCVYLQAQEVAPNVPEVMVRDVAATGAHGGLDLSGDAAGAAGGKAESVTGDAAAVFTWTVEPPLPRGLRLRADGTLHGTPPLVRARQPSGFQRERSSTLQQPLAASRAPATLPFLCRPLLLHLQTLLLPPLLQLL